MSRVAVAGPEVPMIVQQDHEPVVGERLCEPLDAVLFGRGVSARHRHRGMGAAAIGHVEPPAQRDRALRVELDIQAFRHRTPASSPPPS